MSQKIPFTHMAAVASVFAPFVSLLLAAELMGYFDLFRQFDPRTLGMVAGILSAVSIVVGLILSIGALVLAKEHGLPTTKSTAVLGLVFNIIAACLFIVGMLIFYRD